MVFGVAADTRLRHNAWALLGVDQVLVITLGVFCREIPRNANRGPPHSSHYLDRRRVPVRLER